MKNLAWIICPNGGGHIYRSERSFILLKDFLTSKNFKSHFWGPKPKSESFINESFEIISKSNDYTWPSYKIKGFNPSNFDLIISDNIIEKNLGYFLKENKSLPFIFLSSFMWELIDPNYDRNQISWIFDRSNYQFIFNKYFYNKELIGKPKNYNAHGLTSFKKKFKVNKSNNDTFILYITLGIRDVINEEIIKRIESIIYDLTFNYKVYIDYNLSKYLKNFEIIDHEEGLSKANLIICRPGLGTLNQALCEGITHFITCPEHNNREMISNESSLKNIVSVKNIFDKNILDYIYKAKEKNTSLNKLNTNGFVEIKSSIENYINKHFL